MGVDKDGYYSLKEIVYRVIKASPVMTEIEKAYEEIEKMKRLIPREK